VLSVLLPKASSTHTQTAATQQQQGGGGTVAALEKTHTHRQAAGTTGCCVAADMSPRHQIPHEPVPWGRHHDAEVEVCCRFGDLGSAPAHARGMHREYAFLTSVYTRCQVSDLPQLRRLGALGRRAAAFACSAT